MTSLGVLVQGELQRMQRYHILTGGFVVALIWVLALYLMDAAMLRTMFTTVLYLDAVSMPMLLVGVSLYFERQEGSLKSMLVAPIARSTYVTSKLLVLILSGIITLAVLYIYGRFFRGLDVHLLGLIVTVVLCAAFHTLLGFLATYRSKDFTSLLMNVMAYMLLLGIPVILEFMGLFNHRFLTALLYALPTKAVMVMLSSSVNNSFNWEFVYGLLYFLAVGALLFRQVLSGFAPFAEKEGGV